jgi:hypothetical protein
VVDKLRKKGGKANGSLAGIGKLIGSKSKTATHRVLHRCAEMGLVRLATGPDGVRVAIALGCYRITRGGFRGADCH